ncbi:MAG: putative metal-binding motif-containing protein, partial [Myxococcota bacterium]
MAKSIAFHTGLLPLLSAVALGLAWPAALGCGSDDDDTDVDFTPLPIDVDGDGFTADEDCDDENRFTYPGADEPCDGVDNNCDGVIDEPFDQDGDFFSTCNGDCSDNDPTTFLGAPEIPDGLDNDCDGIADNNNNMADDDGDGYDETHGDCNDDPNNGGALIGPLAVEVQFNANGEPEGIDNDCDGLVDEGQAPCPVGGDIHDPLSYANAIDACAFTLSAGFDSSGEATIDPRSRNIFDHFGDHYEPLSGGDMVVLSTGVAGDEDFPLYDGLSTNLDNEAPHPDPVGPVGACGEADEDQINDYTEVVLRLQVPANASGFSFDFNFMSIEFPEWVCSRFDDTFLALLSSSAFTGNVSFDSLGNRVS